MAKLLLAAKISLCSLYGGVAQKKLNLGIFSIIRGTSKADGKGALETQPELCNIFD